MTDLDEKIAAIRAGLGGVTPGPWDVMSTLTVRSIDGDLAIPIFASLVPWRKRGKTTTVLRQEWHNAHHIARLDPQTVAAILDRLERAERLNRLWREAFETGRNEPLQIAFEEARND